MFGRSILLAAAILLVPSICEAGGEAEHRLMIAAVAEAMGFRPEDAKVIADGSWSMDQNDSTIAFRGFSDVKDYLRHRLRVTRDPELAGELLSSNESFDRMYFDAKGEMSRIAPAAFIHALMRDPHSRGDDSNTPGLDHAFQSYIDQQSQRLHNGGATLTETRRLQLLLTGQYLHQVVDSFVHPDEPLVGHGWHGHAPDRAFNHPEEYAQAMVKVMQVLRTMPADLRPLRHRATALQLDSTEGQVEFAKGLVDTAANGYAPFYSRGVLVSKAADFIGAVDTLAIPVIEVDLERYLNARFSDADLDDVFEMPGFTKARFTPGGNNYEIWYDDQRVHVDNLITWVQERPEFVDLVESLRKTVRDEITEWQLQRLAAIVVSNVRDEDVGGVLLHFEPGAAETALSDDQLIALIEQARASVEGGESQSVVLRVGAASEDFELVSLKTIVAENSPTLGGLTRVRGYVADRDDLLLVGRIEPGRAPIPTELLTVALTAVYRDGTWPFVSLDPSPYDPLGPQIPRIGGLAAQHEESEFVRIMLDADYDMKRIMLGELVIDIPGFKSEFELLQEMDGPRTPELRRFWLAPLMASAGDVMVNGPAVVFESHIQVLTEREKQAGEFIVDHEGGESHGELSAQYLTHYYAQIAERVESFHQLYGVFDCAKLAAVLRHQNVEHSLLDTLLARDVAKVTRHDGRGLREPYQGIGPKIVPGTIMTIGGGASSRQRLHAGSFVQSAAVGRLLDGETTLTLEATIPLDRAEHPELLLSKAVRALADGDADECINLCTRTLEVDPAYWEARAYRALALLETGLADTALADLDTVVESQRRLLGLRGVAKLRIGDTAGALADVDAAALAAPDDEAVWTWNASVKALAMDLDGAQRAVDELTAINPASEAAADTLGLILWLRRMDPADIPEWSHSLLNLPFGLIQSLSDGHAAFELMDFSSAAQNLRRSLELSRQYADHPAVKSFHAHERSLMALAHAEAMEARMGSVLSAVLPGGAAPAPRDADADVVLPGVATADELIRLHPDWPSGYFTKALCALVQPQPIEGLDPKSLIDQGLEREQADDPLWNDWKIVLGEQDPARALYAMGLQLSLVGMRSAGAQANPAALAGKLPTSYLRALKEQPGLTGRMAGALLPYFEVVELIASMSASEARDVPARPVPTDDAIEVREPPRTEIDGASIDDPRVPDDGPAFADDPPPRRERAELSEPLRNLPHDEDTQRQKQAVIDFVRRVVDAEQAQPLIESIRDSESADEILQPLAIGVLRSVLGKNHSRPVVERIEAAGSVEQVFNDPATMMLLAEAVRASFADVYDATRDEAPGDLASSVVYSLFMIVYSVAESMLGDPDRAMDVAHDHVLRLPLRAVTLEGSRQLGTLRLYALALLAGSHVVTQHRDLLPLPEFRPLRENLPLDVARGTLSPEDLVRNVTDRDARFLQRLESDHSPFTNALIRTIVDPLHLAGIPAQPALHRARMLCFENPDLTEAERERILAGIDAEIEQIRGGIAAALLERFIGGNQHLTQEERNMIMQAVAGGPELAREQFGGLDAFEGILNRGAPVFDIYGVLAPIILDAETPAELETLTPLLSYLDQITAMLMMPGLNAMARGDADDEQSQRAMRLLRNSLFAGKGAIYEQIRLKSIHFQREELDRLDGR